MGFRETYVAARIGARMQERADSMVLRRASLLPGPVPYKNPPTVSADATVSTGINIFTIGNGGAPSTSQDYFGVSGTTVEGRLVAGDQIVCSATAGGAAVTTWTVQTMPPNVMTDSDGIPLVGPDGTPQFGMPTLYFPDALAANNAFDCVPVTPTTGTPDPAASIGQFVSFIFLTDTQIYGRTLSLTRMTQMGWTEVDAIGVSFAAYSPGVGVVAPPGINDMILVNGLWRSVMTVAPTFRQGTQLMYQVQAR